VAQVLGVREAGGEPPRAGLERFLRGKRLLLVLDNVEHLLPAAPLVADLLAACPDLKVLATSRAPLRLRGERQLPVPPLGLPDPDRLPPLGQLAAVEAVELFVARAQDVKPDFALSEANAPAVAEIVRRLDGLPLALELAAARVNVLPPAALLARLERRLPLLTGGAQDLPARQRTLRDTIAWSHDLLPPEEQVLFRRLAVFAGECTLEAAEPVANAAGEVGMDLLDGVSSLVDKSLLRQDDRSVPEGNPEPRFGMLETIREYALERLDAAGEAEATRRAHAAHFLALAEGLRPRIEGADEPAVLARYDAEHANLRAALAWALDRGEADVGLRLVAALWKFWYLRKHLAEGRSWLQRALAEGAAAAPGLRAEALYAASSFAGTQGDYAAATRACEEGLALARRAGDPLRVAMHLFSLGMTASGLGDRPRARARFEEALTLARGLDPSHPFATHLLANVLRNLGGAVEGEPAATPLLEEALAIWRARGDPSAIANALDGLGDVARLRGDGARAAALYREALAGRAEVGEREGIADSLERLAWLAAAGPGAERAARLFGAAEALREEIAVPRRPREGAEHGRGVAAARSALGAEAFAVAWEAGRALPLEQAVTEALASAEAIASADAESAGTPAAPVTAVDGVEARTATSAGGQS
jgi:predicted ATPase